MILDKSYTVLMKDIEKYLIDKIPEIDPATATELGAYITNRFSIFMQDYARYLHYYYTRGGTRPRPRMSSSEEQETKTDII